MTEGQTTIDNKVIATGEIITPFYEDTNITEVEKMIMTERTNMQTQLTKNLRGQPKLIQQQINLNHKAADIEQQILDITEARRLANESNVVVDQLTLDKENAKLALLQEQLETAQRAATFAGQFSDTFANALETNLVKALNDFATGAKNMKEAFLDMTQAVLKAMIQIMAQQAAMRILGVFGFGGIGGRYGGTFNSPGYRSYAHGGIAQGPKSGYPVTLHGREAVVPLGNDRSIPVEFKGGGGDMNPNITVNVSTMGGQSTTAGNSTNQQKQLGQAVAAAVQAELLDQQKPGGILSPYGNGGDI